MSDIYRGWKITYSASRPVTGVYVAESYGVEMCAGSRVAIERMVDTRIREYPPDGHGGHREQQPQKGENMSKQQNIVIEDAKTGAKRDATLSADKHGVVLQIGGKDIILDLSDGKVNVYAPDTDDDPSEVIAEIVLN